MHLVKSFCAHINLRDSISKNQQEESAVSQSQSFIIPNRFQTAIANTHRGEIIFRIDMYKYVETS